jgi:hypothetical protein
MVRTFPVSAGILEHKRRMGSAIWEFLWLLDHVTSDEPSGDGKFDGIVQFGNPISAAKISSELDESVDTAKVNLRRLESEGYVIRQWVLGAGHNYTVTNSKKWIWRRENRKKARRIENPSTGNLPLEGTKPADDRVENPPNNKEGKTLGRQRMKNPPNPPLRKGGLSDRDRRRLAEELERIYAASVGASSDPGFEEKALQRACARLMIPLHLAREAIDESYGEKAG